MSFETYQKDVDKRISQFEDGYRNNDKILRQIMEEVGEIAKVLSYMDGTKKPKKWEKVEALDAEVADLLFSVICLINSNKINPDDAFKKMMEEKRWKRDNNRFEKKEK